MSKTTAIAFWKRFNSALWDLLSSVWALLGSKRPTWASKQRGVSCEGETWTVSLECKGISSISGRGSECSFLCRLIRDIAFYHQYNLFLFAASASSVGCAFHPTGWHIVTVLLYSFVLLPPLRGSFLGRFAPSWYNPLVRTTDTVVSEEIRYETKKYWELSCNQWNNGRVVGSDSNVNVRWRNIWAYMKIESIIVQRIGNMQRHSTGRDETHRPDPYLGTQWALSYHNWVDGTGRGDGGIVLNCANEFRTQLGRKEKSATPSVKLRGKFVIKRERETTWPTGGLYHMWGAMFSS